MFGTKQFYESRGHHQPVSHPNSVASHLEMLIVLVNRLLRAARDAENSQSREYRTLVEAVRLEHVQVAQDQLKSPEIRDQVIADISGECERVLKVLEAAQTLGEISARCVDKVISTGEKLSCRVMAALLQDR